MARFDGVMRARVTRVDAEGPWVEVPDLGVGQEFGPCESMVEGETGEAVVAGARVLVASVGGTQEDIVILGVMPSPPIRDLAIPAGHIWFSAATTIADGWLECDGSTFSAVTYPRLAAALGGTVLPDLRGRMPIGAGGGAAFGDTDGLAVGARAAAREPTLATDPSVGSSLGGDAASVASVGHTHDVPHPPHPYIALRALIKT